MDDSPPKRTSRRRFLRFAGVGTTAVLAGCSDDTSSSTTTNTTGTTETTGTTTETTTETTTTSEPVPSLKIVDNVAKYRNCGILNFHDFTNDNTMSASEYKKLLSHIDSTSGVEVITFSDLWQMRTNTTK